jgi:hypothetical protein
LAGTFQEVDGVGMSDGFITSINSIRFNIGPSDLISFDLDTEIAERKPSTSKSWAFEGDDYIGFTHNKYFRWYAAILLKAHDRGVIPKPFDRHHPWPRSIPGGTRQFGFVTIPLTFREHFLCHWLLTKFTEGDDLYKMEHALNRSTQSNTGQKIVSSWQYEVARRAVRKAQLGKTHTAETRAKLSAAGRGRKQTAEARAANSAARRGKPLSPAHRAAAAASRRTPEVRAKISASNMGRTVTPETRAKISAWQKGKPKGPQSASHRASRVLALNVTVECAHCHRHVDRATYSHFHGDRCKHNHLLARHADIREREAARPTSGVSSMLSKEFS